MYRLNDRCLACPVLMQSDQEEQHMSSSVDNQHGAIGYALLWLIGIPLPLLLILFLIFR